MSRTLSLLDKLLYELELLSNHFRYRRGPNPHGVSRLERDNILRERLRDARILHRQIVFMETIHVTQTQTQAAQQTETLDFGILKNAVAAQFTKMLTISNNQLFRTGADIEGCANADEARAIFRDQMYDRYLSAFPAGTNPVYRERTEHDCSACKSFIRNIGNVVAIVDNQLVSIWDINVGGAYQVVADAMSAFVKAHPVVDIFLHTERTAGVNENYEALDGGGQRTWRHLFVNLPPAMVVAGADLGTKLNGPRMLHGVMLRSLTELTPDAVETVMDLIGQNNVYRLAEFKGQVQAFQRLQRDFLALAPDVNKDNFVWAQVRNISGAVGGIRNTAVGTLLTDLSEGMELESAIRRFETSTMAPTNYKRPTALVTPRMLEQAKQTINELGLMSALERRHAALTDIKMTDILFADRSTKPLIQGDGSIFDELAASMPQKAKNYDKVDEVTMKDFLTNILPHAKAVSIMFEARHAPRLVSLTTSVDPTAGQLFKWPNSTSWAYNGDVADSIKERVKAAGGNVTGDLCCRLAWYNGDDLDLHMIEPGGYELYYGTKHSKSPSGGMLDVDMNAGGAHNSKDPVENIFYTDKRTLRDGVYTLVVNQYNPRSRDNVGFEIEFDFLGTVHRYAYEKAMPRGQNVEVVKFRYNKAAGTIEIIDSLPSTAAVKTIWGLQTETFHKVNVVTLSPNHWDGAGRDEGVGNLHYFFIIDGCLNPDPVRGFFNENLNPALNEHRKAFELVGSKMKADYSPNQMSGLGFSSSQDFDVLVKVEGAFTRVVKLKK